MRLHSLTLTAFGPYPGTEHADFDALAADRLFLLHGETGAGKTALLDAVAFAVYGRVPGARGEISRLRSDHAGPGVRTEVALELTLAGERLRVTRRPQQERPKARGGGTTTEKAKVTLARQTADGEWVEVATAHADVADYLQARLGLTAEQFFQVVLLPQGEFARFLRAEPEERAALLDKLFGAERFRYVEDWLAGRRRDSRAELDRAGHERDAIAARAAQVAGWPADGVPTEPGTEWMRDLVDAAAYRLDADRAEVGAADAGWREADEARRAAVELADRQARLAAARADRAGVEERRPAVTDERERLASARRADPVRPLLAGVERARAAVAAAATARDERRAELAALDPAAPGDSTDDADSLREWAAAVRADVGRLTDLVADESALVESMARIERLTAELAARDVELAELAERADVLPGERDAALSRVSAAESAAASVETAEAAVAELDQALAAAESAGRLTGRVDSLAAGERDAVDAHQAARERLLRVREHRLAGIAAELAAGLHPHQPCPVCGAREHPYPAPLADSDVGEAAEHQAQAAVDAAETRRQEATAALSEARAELAAASGRVAGRGPDELAAEAEAARERRDAATVAVAALPELRERRDRLDAELADLERRTAAVRADRAAYAEQLAVLTAAEADRRNRVERARGDAATVADRRDRLARAVEAADALLTATAAHAQRAAELSRATDAADTEARAAGFDDVSAAEAAALAPAEIAAIERRLAEFDADDARTAAVIQLPELADLPDEPAAVDCATATATAARERRDTAVAALAAAERAHAQLGGLADELAAALERAEPLRTAYAETAALADLVAGGGANRLRMRLQSFVLAARLEQVAHAATERLGRMSRGRYTFCHTDELARRGARSGLGLDVLDAHTGQTRSTKTLSGGESFLASLALALGLADVVTAEAGATTLDSLFVDEGFGSLDAGTLDTVMDTLDDLRAGGRVVGLISHVEELKARIPTRLLVRTGPHGSRLSAPTHEPVTPTPPRRRVRRDRSLARSARTPVKPAASRHRQDRRVAPQQLPLEIDGA